MTEGGTHPLEPVLAPTSVVIVGASSDPRKRGHQVLRALEASGYRGQVYPVNPRGGEILGRKVVPSIEDLPGTPDLALICTPSASVPEAVAACGRKGIRGAVVLAVGFGESGQEGAALEQALLDAAREGGVRVVGPNTSGLLNLPLGLNLIGAPDVRAGSIALLVQSGNMALSLMNEVTARTGQGVSLVIGVGNQTDLGFAEYLDYLGSHQGTRAVVVYAEGFRDTRDFLEAAARVTPRTPVLLLKGARSSAGQAAARSHTGAVAGEWDVLQAGLRQAGVVVLTRTDELSHVAETLATQPPVEAGRGVVVLSDGGGQGTLAADALSDLGVPLDRPSPATQGRLRELLGPAAAVANPVDLAGAADADPEVFAQALEVLLRDAEVGGVLVVGLFGGYALRFAESLAEGEVRAADRMVAAAREAQKAVIVHSMYAARRAEPLQRLGEGGLPVVESLEVACRCVAEVWRRGRRSEEGSAAWGRTGSRRGGGASGGTADVSSRQAAGPRAASDTDDTALLDHATFAGLLDDAASAGRDALTEAEARTVLAGAGVPFPEQVVCTDAEATAAAVARLGVCAVKVLSPRIVHKSDAGGVILGVDGSTQALDAFRQISDSASAWLSSRNLPPDIEGVTVTPMLAPPLAELLVGARRDPELGPVLTVGAGGTWVEVMRDVAHRVLPVTDLEVEAMLGELRIHALLSGSRGRPRAELPPLVAAVQAVAATLDHHPPIREVEVNPLFAYPREVFAVDARVIL